MEKEQIIKFVLAGIFLILLFFVGTGYTTTNYNNTSYVNGTLDASNKINKTGDTVGNSFRLDTTDGNGYIATTTNSNIIGYNVGSLSTLRRSEYRGYPGYAQIYLRSGIATTRTYNFSLDGVDLDTKNISNCGNCVNKSETQYNNDMNTKVNKSGDNLSNALNWINNSYIGGVGVTDVSDSMQTVLRFLVGRGINGTTVLNGTYMSTRGYIAIINGHIPTNGGRGLRFRYFPDNSTTPITFMTSNEDNTTLDLGNFTVSSLSGSGNAYACIDSTGKLYRGNPTC